MGLFISVALLSIATGLPFDPDYNHVSTCCHPSVIPTNLLWGMPFTQAGNAASAVIRGPYNDVVNQYNTYNLVSNAIDDTTLCKNQLQVLSGCVSKVVDSLGLVESSSQEMQGENSVHQLEYLRR